MPGGQGSIPEAGSEGVREGNKVEEEDGGEVTEGKKEEGPYDGEVGGRPNLKQGQRGKVQGGCGGDGGDEGGGKCHEGGQRCNKGPQQVTRLLQDNVGKARQTKS